MEQLAINFCNEKLQNQFINYVVFKEQEIYLSEGIDFQHVTPKVNKDIISLIEGTPDGIFSILEDLVLIKSYFSFLKLIQYNVLSYKILF